MNRLYSKVFGCIAGSQIGSAMGAPVEHWAPERIRETYGKLDRLVEYHTFGRDVPAGTTEDGVERQKLMILAIAEKGGPITARDFAITWLKYVNEESFGVLAGQQDEIHYRLLKAGISPEDSGYYDAHVGRTGFARACQPLGVIHACHPEAAAKCALDVGRIYQPPTGRGIQWKDSDRVYPTYTIGLDWAASVAAAIAEAFKPSATVDTIVEQSMAYVVPPVQKQIRKALDLASRCSDYDQLIEEFGKMYQGKGLPFAVNRAYEVVPKAIALFAFFQGDLRECLFGAVNLGRDTDCLAAIATGIAGAYKGGDGLSAEWVEQVDKATTANNLSICQDALGDLCKRMYEALVQYHRGVKAGCEAVEELLESGATV